MGRHGLPFQRARGDSLRQRWSTEHHGDRAGQAPTIVCQLTRRGLRRGQHAFPHTELGQLGADAVVANGKLLGELAHRLIAAPERLFAMRSRQLSAKSFAEQIGLAAHGITRMRQHGNGGLPLTRERVPTPMRLGAGAVAESLGERSVQPTLDVERGSGKVPHVGSSEHGDCPVLARGRSAAAAVRPCSVLHDGVSQRSARACLIGASAGSRTMSVPDQRRARRVAVETVHDSDAFNRDSRQFTWHPDPMNT